MSGRDSDWLLGVAFVICAVAFSAAIANLVLMAVLVWRAVL